MRGLENFVFTLAIILAVFSLCLICYGFKGLCDFLGKARRTKPKRQKSFERDYEAETDRHLYTEHLQTNPLATEPDF